MKNSEQKLDDGKPRRAPGYIAQPNDRCPCGSGKKLKRCCREWSGDRPTEAMIELAYRNGFDRAAKKEALG